MTAQINLASAGKNELRALCKEHGVKNYGKMTNDGMREALSGLVNQQAAPVVVEEPAPVVEAAPAAPSLLAMMTPIVHDIPKNALTVVRDGSKQADHTAAAVRPATVKVKGYTIQKEREEQNGVKRPSAGTTCAKVWDALDAKAKETGCVPNSEFVRTYGTENSINEYTMRTQYARWRTFNGVKGRV